MKVGSVMRGRREIAAGRVETPKVSIITPTYCRNLEGLLAPCIESALGQSFTDLELIVIDDGSSDGSEETIRDYARQDDRIRYFRHDRNSGLPAVRTNEGILLARGDAVAFLFDDNVMVGDFIEQAHASLAATAVDVVHADVHMLGRQGNDFTLGDWPLGLDLLGNLNTIPNGGVLCRRDFFDRFGLYDPHVLLRRVCDWDLWLRALHLGARFHHLGIRATVEHGIVSQNSIGNTVGWDVKVAYGYLFDTRRYAARTARLRPAAIHDVDVLDVDVVLPYVRNEAEWSDVVKNVYGAFAARNGEAASYPTTLTNRAALDCFGFGAPASSSPQAGRRRYLIVSSTFNEHARAWEEALSAPDRICIHVPEWQLSAVPPDTVDFLILIDACASFVAPVIPLYINAGVPVLYVSRYGFAPAATEAEDLAWQAPIHKLLGTNIYLPEEGLPYDEAQRDEARRMMALADALVVPADLDVAAAGLSHGWIIRAPADPSPRWFRNVLAGIGFRGAEGAAAADRRPPKVVVALNSELLSGSEAYGTMLARGLAGVGFRVEIWLPEAPVYGLSDTALRQRLAELGLPPARHAAYEPSAGITALPRHLREARAAALLADIEQSRPDLIICSGFMPLFAVPDRGEIGLIMALFQPSAYDPAELRQLSGRIDGWISDCAWSRDMVGRVLPDPSAVVRSTVPPMPLSEFDRAAAEGPVRIALGGTLQPRKGQIESIRALAVLLDRGHDVVLNLYGYALPHLAWYRQDIETLVADLGLDGRVRILGLCDLDAIAADNDIVLSASSDESLPQTVAESIARGLIPVVALAGGLDELVVDRANGFVAANRTPEGLAEALERALAERDDWPVLRRKSALLLRLFDGDRATESLLSLMVRVPDARRTPAAGVHPVLPLTWAPDPERAARVEELRQRKAALARQNGLA